MKIRTKLKTVVDYFVESGLITEQMLETAMAEQRQTHEHLANILVKRGFISEDAINAALSRDMDMEHLSSLDDIEWTPDLTDLLKPEFLREYKCMPVFIDDEVVRIGISNPSDIVAMDAAREALREYGYELEVQFVSVSEKAIFKVLDDLFPETIAATVVDDEMKSLITRAVKEVRSMTTDAENLSIQQVVDKIISLGASWKASDIHINPEESHVQVRYRLDGVLSPGPSIPNELQNSIVSRIKIMSDLNISERRAPQDGKVAFTHNDAQLDLRVSIIPTAYGENIVIRILERDRLFGLEILGFPSEILDALKDIADQSYGIFLVTGPTGSGKSTTLYSVLQSMNAIEKNIITLEDPIEYRLPFIRQSQTNPAVDYTFATGLRAFLRHDPDVILVGEIRDNETAAMAFHAAQTGHLVLSTLHTNTSIGALGRLVSMDIELFLISTILKGILAQRLVRVICSQCKEGYPPSRVEKGWLGEEDLETLYEGDGCSKCKNKGYGGRVGIYELFVPDDEICQMILDEVGEVEIKKAAKRKNMPFFYNDAKTKIIEGVTTFEEVLRVLPELG